MQITDLNQIKREGKLYIVFAHGYQHTHTTAWTQEREAREAYKKAVDGGLDAILCFIPIWEPRKKHRYLQGRRLTLGAGGITDIWNIKTLEDSRMVEHREMEGLANYPRRLHITLD